MRFPARLYISVFCIAFLMFFSSVCMSAENDVSSRHPRPGLRRSDWKSLDGVWNYKVVSKLNEKSVASEGKIRVPFPIESPLSEAGFSITPENVLIYSCKFEVPATWKGKLIILNFEAADWDVEAFVNGESVGRHQGGYAPFSFDITDSLSGDGEQTLEVKVYDPTEASWQPRGDQNSSESVGSSPVTGIWGSVWIEPVSDKAYVSELWSAAGKKTREAFTPSTDGFVFVSGSVVRTADAMVRIQICDANKSVVANREVPVQEFGYFGANLKIESPQLWTAQNPYLYKIEIEVVADNVVCDSVKSYLGIRTVDLVKDEKGQSRIAVNGVPTFLLGVRRDGWRPDGFYTAPSDEAIRSELKQIKEMGFNWIYQHGKVESRRFYFWCDVFGLMVWQEFPGGDDSIAPGEADLVRSRQSETNFYSELGEMIETLRSSPSIIAWVPFNEGSGQFSTSSVIQWTKEQDVTRLVDGPSGWEDRGAGDVLDVHRFNLLQKAFPTNRAVVLSKFSAVDPTTSAEQLYSEFVNTVKRHGGKLSGAAFGRLTDAGRESDGILSADRKTNKIGAEKVLQFNEELLQSLPTPSVHGKRKAH